MAKSIPTLQFANGKMVEIQARLTVGRDSNNDVRIKDASVSGFHALLACHAGRVYVRDLDSVNGVFVNGQAISQVTELKNNDVIRFGTLGATVRIGQPTIPIAQPFRDKVKKQNRQNPIVLLFTKIVAIVVAGVLLGSHWFNQISSQYFPNKATPLSQVQILDQTKRATVQVLTCPAPCSGQPSVGSGVLIEMFGQLRILTAWHVVEPDPQAVTVSYNLNSDEQPNMMRKVEVVLIAQELDLALLRFIEPPVTDLLPLGLSDRIINTGDKIVITGFPSSVGFDKGVTVLTSTVSNISSTELLVGQPFDGGNSGGAATNSDGQLIGIVIATRENFGVIRSVRAIKEFLQR